MSCDSSPSAKNNGSSYIPVETVDEILIMGEAEINKSLIELLSEKGIVLHFFDHFGKYTERILRELWSKENTYI